MARTKQTARRSNGPRPTKTLGATLSDYQDVDRVLSSRSLSVAKHWHSVINHFDDSPINRARRTLIGRLPTPLRDLASDIQTSVPNVAFKHCTILTMSDDRCFKLSYSDSAVAVIIPLTAENVVFQLSTNRCFPNRLTTVATMHKGDRQITTTTNCFVTYGLGGVVGSVDAFVKLDRRSDDCNFPVIILEGQFVVGATNSTAKKRERQLIEIDEDDECSHSSSADGSSPTGPTKKRVRIV